VTPGEHELRNREFWNADADDYQAVHSEQLARGKVWGVWAIPEAELGMLGATRGVDVLELGCGAAHWSMALADEGACVVAIDQSRGQLRHAALNVANARGSVRFLCASGESVPARDRSFDIIFCDHGAMTFCDPYRTVPEVARLLRPGGVLVFNHSTPLTLLTDGTKKLQRDWYEMRRLAWPEGTTEFQLGHGEWIHLFRAHGLVVENLIELQAPAGSTTTYDDFVTFEWARRWPAEQIWKVRKLNGVRR
jgi:SAM-dependent methyltransferase